MWRDDVVDAYHKLIVASGTWEIGHLAELANGHAADGERSYLVVSVESSGRTVYMPSSRLSEDPADLMLCKIIP